MALFDATHQDSNVPTFPIDCPGVDFNTTPAQQWESVRGAWSGAHPTSTEKPGASLGFPFTQSFMTTQLPSLLGKMLRVCSGP